MRHFLLGCFLFFSIGVSGQSEKFSIQFENLTLEEVLELVTASTGNFFSYSSDILPQGNRFTMNEEDKTIDDFLNKLLIGTGLKHQVFENQIVLTIREVLVDNLERPSNFYTISGRVIDDLSKEPIPTVNVFLSGTNLGGVTDLDGYYSIGRVPFGYYEIIFSHLTYYMDTQDAELLMNGTVTVNSELAFKSILLDSIEIVSRRLIGPTERRRYLRVFSNEFLGQSTSGQKCRIENPEVLDFIFDPKLDKLEVFSLEPLKIVNENLGYEVTYFFDRFQKIGASTNFYGRARFQNIKPETKRQEKRWLRNRRSIYKGSFLHFRRALVLDELKKENFKIRLIPVSSLDEVKISKGVNVDRDAVLTEMPAQEFLLNFDDFLMVTYRNKPDESYYEQFFDVSGATPKQRSLLRLAKGNVILKNNGRMELPGISTFGYWYWERLGDLLPENYDPESDKL